MKPKPLAQLKEELKALVSRNLNTQYENGEIAGYSIVEGSQGIIINVRPLQEIKSINVNIDTTTT